MKWIVTVHIVMYGFKRSASLINTRDSAFETEAFTHDMADSTYKMSVLALIINIFAHGIDVLAHGMNARVHGMNVRVHGIAVRANRITVFIHAITVLMFKISVFPCDIHIATHKSPSLRIRSFPPIQIHPCLVINATGPL